MDYMLVLKFSIADIDNTKVINNIKKGQVICFFYPK